MSNQSPILDVLNRYLPGPIFASIKAELFGILRDVAKSIARGELTLEQFKSDLKKIADSIAAHRQINGFSTNVSQLLKDLESAIVTESTMYQTWAIRERLASLRRRSRRRSSQGPELI